MILSINKTTTLVQSFTYNFSTAGGAVGSYNTGLQIQQGCLINYTVRHVKTGVTSGGLATIALGTSINPNLIIPATPIIQFGTNSSITNLVPQIMDSSFNILMAINLFPLTAGLFQITIVYQTPTLF